MSDGPHSHREAGLVLEKVEVPRAATVFASQIRQSILAGEISPGSHLPPERELVLQSGVGRASVREGLRLLEAEDLIEPKVGRYGGWMVRRPGHDAVVRSIDVLIRAHQLNFDSVLEARAAIEPACAALAARNRTDMDLTELENRSARLHEVWTDVPEYLLENLRWHLAVVHATHNELLIAFMTGLSDAIYSGTQIKDFNSENIRLMTLKAHDRVLEAIGDGDEDAAFRRMYRHIHDFQTLVESPVDSPLPVSPRRRTRSSSRADSGQRG